MLIYIRDKEKIESVSVGGKECKSFPDSIQDINDLKLLDDEQLVLLAKQCGCYKSPSSHKADVVINGNEMIVKFKEKQRAITEGQSVVLYKDNICIGGGIIEDVY